MGTKIVINSDLQRNRNSSSEVERLICDNTKIINNTKWMPRYSLREGLIETIDWLKLNLNLYKPEIYNV